VLLFAFGVGKPEIDEFEIVFLHHLHYVCDRHHHLLDKLVNQLKLFSADCLRIFHTHRKIAEFCFLGQSCPDQHKTCHPIEYRNLLIFFVFNLPYAPERTILVRHLWIRTFVGRGAGAEP
jgi:hypothetical protein